MNMWNNEHVKHCQWTCEPLPTQVYKDISFLLTMSVPITKIVPLDCLTYQDTIFNLYRCVLTLSLLLDHRNGVEWWLEHLPSRPCSSSLFRLAPESDKVLTFCNKQETLRSDWLLPHEGKMLLSTSVATKFLFPFGSFVVSSTQSPLLVLYWNSQISNDRCIVCVELLFALMCTINLL